MNLLLKLITRAALLTGTVACALRFGMELRAETSGSATVAWLGGFLACAVVLGLCLAWDLSRFLGNRAERWILQGEAPPVLPPELREAERRVTAREPLAALNLLRDYLVTHPGAVYVHYRIAELYAESLANPLAAALEYEVLLAGPLDGRRWSWTALRLARLYRTLREFEKAEALLQQILRDHPRSGAARRARVLLAEWE
jgi:tetratricopeptide (TPR) repeat protein